MKLVNANNVAMHFVQMYKKYDVVAGTKLDERFEYDFQNFVRKLNHTRYNQILRMNLKRKTRGLPVMEMPPLFGSKEEEEANRNIRRFQYESFEEKINRISRENRRTKEVFQWGRNSQDWDFRVHTTYGGPQI